MQRVYLFALCMALVAAFAMAADKTISHKQISVMLKENGGGVTCTATQEAKEAEDEPSGESNEDDATTAEPEPETTTTAVEDDTNDDAGTSTRKRRAADDDLETTEVMVTLDSVMEVDAEGVAVGSSRTPNPNVDNFEGKMFTFDTMSDDADALVIRNSVKSGSTEDAIPAVMQSYHYAPENGPTLKILAYIAKEAGNITVGEGDETEMIEVMEGQIKLAVELEGWTFCVAGDAPNCVNGETNEVGEFIDMKITVTGSTESKQATAEDGKPDVHELGEDNLLMVSKMVGMTGSNDAMTWEKMADTYPKYARDGSKTMITLRFPKFEKSLWYDPNIRLKVPGSDLTSGGANVAASLAVIVLSAIAAFLRM